jgi:hypothetical protein
MVNVFEFDNFDTVKAFSFDADVAVCVGVY